MKKLLILLMAAMFLVACGNDAELENTIAEQEKEIEELKEELELVEDRAEIFEAAVNDQYEEEEIEEGDETDDEIEEKESIELSPGTYYFGEDIEPGRYTVTYESGYNGTIIFRGEERFGENFGTRDGYLYDYIFTAKDGEEIEVTIPAILFPED